MINLEQEYNNGLSKTTKCSEHTTLSSDYNLTNGQA